MGDAVFYRVTDRGTRAVDDACHVELPCYILSDAHIAFGVLELLGH